MAANTAPLYTIRGDASRDNGNTMPAVLTTATATVDGTDANNTLVHTAGSSGSYVRAIEFKAKGTNVASKVYIYLNNGSTNGTAGNNQLIAEESLPATTASNTAPTAVVVVPINRMIKSGWTLYAGLGTTVAAGWQPAPIAGQYE